MLGEVSAQVVLVKAVSLHELQLPGLPARPRVDAPPSSSAAADGSAEADLRAVTMNYVFSLTQQLPPHARSVFWRRSSVVSLDDDERARIRIGYLDGARIGIICSISLPWFPISSELAR